MKYIDRQYSFVERQLRESAKSVGIDLEFSADALIALALFSDDKESKLEDLCYVENSYEEASRLLKIFNSKSGYLILKYFGDACMMADRNCWLSRDWEQSCVIDEWAGVDGAEKARTSKNALSHRVLCDFAMSTGIVANLCAVYLDPNKPAAMGAKALHSKPGGSWEKAKKIREIWATGKYSNRNVCAEQECAALKMSYETARKALRNTTKPA